MIRNRLGLPARFLMVATAVACWIPCVPAAAAGMPLVQTAPPAPTNLVATLEGTSVRLTWTASAPLPDQSLVTGYRIQMYYRPQLSDWIDVVANTGTTALTYLHTAPPRGTTVFYQVAAINAAGREGNYSNDAQVVTTTGSTGRPLAPLNLTATIVGLIVTLAWNAPTWDGGSPITVYEIDVSADNGAWTRVADKPATETRHVGRVRVGVIRTAFRVTARNANGAGIPASVDATTATTRIPGAPQNLRATADGPTAINLDWAAPSSTGRSAITGYEVSVSADGGVSFGPPQTTVQTSYRHTGLSAGATRHYRVRARNAIGFGPWTSVVNATTSAGTPPGPPRALRGDRRRFLGDRTELDANR